MGHVSIPRPPGCGCGDADTDDEGRVLLVKTCPICMRVLFATMRGTEYASAHVSSGDTVKHVLLKQLDFFSP